MKSPLFWCLLLVLATWQIEMAVHSGIAAAKRPAPAKAQVSTNKASAPICVGPSCPPSQPQLTPQRVIISPR